MTTATLHTAAVTDRRARHVIDLGADDAAQVQTLARDCVGSFDDPEDPWVGVARRTRDLVSAARTRSGEPYEIVQPTTTRRSGADFLGTYMNYDVCNGAVIAPEFGDGAADAAAKAVLQKLFPERAVVMLNIDALAAGGGGIHCATQQQPKI